MDFTEISLSSQRLVMTPFSPDDASESFAVQTKTLTRFMGWDPALSLHEFAGVWRSWLLSMGTGADVYLTIRLKSSREYLGMAGLHRIADDEPELGIWIKESQRLASPVKGGNRRGARRLIQGRVRECQPAAVATDRDRAERSAPGQLGCLPTAIRPSPYQVR